MTRITGGELLLRCFAQEGVKRVIGISDEGYHAVQHRCAAYGLRHVAPRHEAAAAHIAQGIYKASGEMSVVLAGGGPGVANVLAGVICAQAESVPMIVVTAQRRSQVVYPGAIGIFQAADQYDWFKPITKWNAVVHDWRRIPEIVARAFREAWAGRPGPVQIDVPIDIMDGEDEESRIVLRQPWQYRAVTRLALGAEDLRFLIDLLKDARRPALLAGAGVLQAGGGRAFVELAERLHCPALTTSHGRTVLADSHPLHLRSGSAGHFAARREADLILAFGTCLGEIDFPFDKYWGDSGQKLVQIDIDPRHLGVNRPLHRGLIADAGAALEQLSAAIRSADIPAPKESRLAHYQALSAAEEERHLGAMRSAFRPGTIHPGQSIAAVQDVFGERSIYVYDGGNTGLFTRLLGRFAEPRTLIGNFEFGHLGTGIPHAIGAKLARPERDVVCITGDGAAGFNVMELETAVREKTKITVVVHAEGSWSMEEVIHRSKQADEDSLRSCLMAPTRWDEIGKAVGCFGEEVREVDDLASALRRARDAAGPAVISVRTDRAANLHPPGLELFDEVYFGPKEDRLRDSNG